MTEPTLLLKTITTIRPEYFDDGRRAEYTYVDANLGHNTTSVDFGHLFWNRHLCDSYLEDCLTQAGTAGEEPQARLHHDLDVQAIRQLGHAKSILGSYSARMPSAGELLYCFRVISRCAAIASRHQQGLDVHVTRGLIATEYDQYRLADILKAAEVPHETDLGRFFDVALASLSISRNPRVVVINLRNDGELHQAFLVASVVRGRWPDAVIILDASGGNEQFNFAEWVHPLKQCAEQVSRYIDYFLPRQDYKATLRVLLESLARGVHAEMSGTPNLIPFIKDHTLTRQPLPTAPIERAFSDYITNLPTFYAAGQRTIVARLSAAKCHWCACKFCTINTQHIMPRGRASFDATYLRDAETLLNKITDDDIKSLILMDEALEPVVLVGFARAILSKGRPIVYRARCRFSNDLTADVCDLLYESGCRYLGLGLESASPRVNRLVHKHMGAPIDYDTVLQNVEHAGIRMHVYAILGFPTETAEEIAATRDFLIANIRRFRYLTVSANNFYLMRGSAIARAPEEFNIERISENGDMALVLEFWERERNKNQALARLSAQQVYQAEFLPDIADPPTAEAFWHFIDQTGIFYVQKVVHSRNPFHELAEVRKLPLGADFVDQFYEPSFLFWLPSPSDNECCLLGDWVTFNYAEIPYWLKDFVLSFEPAISLRANADNLLLDPLRRDQAYAAFPGLVRSGLLLQRRSRPTSKTCAAREYTSQSSPMPA